MKKLALYLAAAATLAAATPALASGDVPFSGPRIGVDGGWGRVAGHRISSDGFLYGATLGYDVASGPIRFGPEIRLGDSTQKVCRSHPAGGSAARVCERSDRDLYAGAKLGYVVTPKVLLYGTAGYTNVRFSDRFSDLSVGPVKNIDVSYNHDGFRVGGGTEYAVTSNIFVTGAYQYSMWKNHIHQNQLLAGVGYRF